MLISPPISQADLRRFANDKVNLPKEDADERRAKVRDLRDKLATWIKDNPDCGLVKSYISGSVAKGTALRTSSDVDLALYLKHDGERRASRELSEWIAAKLRKAYPQMAPEQIQPNEYSVTITYKGAGFDVDIVPVFYEGDPADRGWLVSKRTGRVLLTSIPMHLEFVRKRKKKQETHFAQVIRLLKWWALQRKGDNADFRFKSFMIELICAKLLDEGQDFADYSQAMAAFFNYLLRTDLEERIAFADYYGPENLPPSLPDPIEILDPVNAENNVACRYTDHNRRLMLAAAEDAIDAINEAHTAATKAHAVEMWQVVLGKSFRGQ